MRGLDFSDQNAKITPYWGQPILHLNSGNNHYYNNIAVTLALTKLKPFFIERTYLLHRESFIEQNTFIEFHNILEKDFYRKSNYTFVQNLKLNTQVGQLWSY